MKKIGIDASRAFMKQRTGIEEYAFQIISNFRDKLKDCKVVLYVRKEDYESAGFELPSNWTAKSIPYNYFWTQIGLSWEMLIHPMDILFVPAHTVPFVHPKKTFVTIHGLEYERCPESYSGYSRWFHRIFVKKSCCWSQGIIAVSRNTKKDLIEMYEIDGEKIYVIYNGVDERLKKVAASAQLRYPKYFRSEFGCFLLFIGRLERRKNVVGIIRAFEILKEQYGYQGKLLLAGKPGFGINMIEKLINESKYQEDIIELGFVSDKERERLLCEADAFMFPSICEGFGIPILEAQSVGTPVITSRIGPLDEVANNPDILVDPKNYQEIASVANRLVEDDNFRQQAINKGLKNVMRFSWEKSAKEIAGILRG